MNDLAELTQKSAIFSAQCQKNLNKRLDKLQFKVYDYDEFVNIDKDSRYIYFVIHGTSVEIWKGSMRIFIGDGKIDHALVEITGTL